MTRFRDGNTNEPALAAEADRVIDQALSSGRIVGAVAIIARDAKVVYQRAAGLADREAGLTNTAIEGMAGRFPTDLRNVVYQWMAQC